ncbi:hypothetical protein MP228_007365 [Amoeboaphelidium protococcarum]|nr:hypothetical protein MP228_007365 [Amoeboaphelidium protococcarum]
MSMSINELEQTVSNVFDTLLEFEDQLDEINVEYAEEMTKLQYQYDVKRQPVFTKRDSLLEKIPHFWPIALQNHSVLSVLAASEHDEELLDVIEGVRVTRPTASAESTSASSASADVHNQYLLTIKFKKDNQYVKSESITKCVTVIDEENGFIENIDAIEWTEVGLKTFNITPSTSSSSSSAAGGVQSTFKSTQEIQESGADDSISLVNLLQGCGNGICEVAALICCDLYPHAVSYYQGPEEDDDDEDYEDYDEEDFEELEPIDEEDEEDQPEK